MQAETTSNDQKSIHVYGSQRVSESMLNCIQKVESGLEAGFEPTLSPEGTSGSYIMKTNDKEDHCPAAVFKPIDEEPFAPHNPRDMQAKFGSETCRPGVKSGESTLREVYAYLLDHEGFSGVPPTCL